MGEVEIFHGVRGRSGGQRRTSMEVASLLALVLYIVQPMDFNIQKLHLMLSSEFSKSNL